MAFKDYVPSELRKPEQIVRDNCLAVIRRDHTINSRWLAAKLRRKPQTIRNLLASKQWTMSQGLRVAKAIGLTEAQAKNPDISAILEAIPLPPIPPRCTSGARRITLCEDAPL